MNSRCNKNGGIDTITPARTPAKTAAISSGLRAGGYYYAIVFLILIIIDRLTKIWAAQLSHEQDYGIFSFVYVTNTGAGFSIFTGQNTLLIMLSLIVLGLLIFFSSSLHRTGVWVVAAGLIGNLIDRVSYGYVIDFINFKFWPVFNVADMMIVLGVIALIIDLWRKDRAVSGKEKSGSKHMQRKTSGKSNAQKRSRTVIRKKKHTQR